MKVFSLFGLSFVTLLASVSFGQASCPFSERDYLALNKDVQAAVFRGDINSGRAHFELHGYLEGRAYNQYCGPRPSAPYCPFVEQEYLDLNADVKAAVNNGSLSSAQAHFAKSGYLENRITSNECYENTYGYSAPATCNFSERDYLALNPDVQASVFRGDFNSGRDHYDYVGSQENRAYNKYCGPAASAPYCPFVEQEYLDLNPDVRAAVYNGSISSGQAHYAKSGYIEKRITSNECYENTYSGYPPVTNPKPPPYHPPHNPPQNPPHHGPVVTPNPPPPLVPGPPASCQFNEQDYLAFNPDVQAAVFRGDFNSGRGHYDYVGAQEGRAYNRKCGPVAYTRYCPFVENEYLDLNPDVRAAVYNGTISSGRQHFTNIGYTENRTLSYACR